VPHRTALLRVMVIAACFRSLRSAGYRQGQVSVGPVPKTFPGRVRPSRGRVPPFSLPGPRWVSLLASFLLSAPQAITQGGGSVELGLLLSTSLIWFWMGRGHVTEGRSWLERLLGCPHAGSGPLCAVALAAAGALASQQRSNAQAVALGERAVGVARETGDPGALA
jgi:hypothetical protein